jgi:hypothetical protein
MYCNQSWLWVLSYLSGSQQDDKLRFGPSFTSNALNYAQNHYDEGDLGCQLKN